MTGREAADMGFANRAVPGAELQVEVRQLAARIAKVPPDLMRIKKAAINSMADLQGFRASVVAGANWDALAHTTRGTAEARKALSRLGVRGASALYR